MEDQSYEMTDPLDLYLVEFKETGNSTKLVCRDEDRKVCFPIPYSCLDLTRILIHYFDLEHS